MHTEERTGCSIKQSPLGAFSRGLFLSAGLALLFHAGISVTYNYLPGSIVLLAGLTVFCFLIFWINIKYDQYLDVNDVFLKTISFNDFNRNNYKVSVLFARFVRPANPYIGALGTTCGLLLILCAVPATIIYWTITPDQAVKLINISVFLISSGMSILYLISNKDQFPSAADKSLVFAGILLGPAGVIKIVS